MKISAKTLLFACAYLAFFLAKPVQADDLGRAEYLSSCASRHGLDASGQGSMAEFLNVDVPDLTGLSVRNGGRLPMLEVLRIIDGRRCGPTIDIRPCARPEPEVAAHGRAMPVWGNRYKDEAVFDDGLQLMNGNPETLVLGRILALAYYLEAIQK